MNIRDFFLENYILLFELIGLLIMLEVSVHISRTMKTQTLAAIGLLFAETLLFSLEKWSQTFETLSLLRPLCTAALYSIYPMIVTLLMQIITTHEFSRRNLLILSIPEIICIPLFFSSQWTHLVFWFHENNHYAGGPLWFLPYVLFGFYALVFLIHNFSFFQENSRKACLVVAYIVFVPILGVIFYLICKADKDYSALFASAIVLYFIFIYIYRAKVDPLTSLLNRQSYYQDINSNARGITGVVSVDMNDLKYLNDNMGHEAGDTALKTVSDIMRKNCGIGGTVYRVGGDEFMIIYFRTKESEITKAISIMQGKMEETPYRCAFGYAMRQPGETVVDTIRRSDEWMYIHKAEMKKKLER